MQVNFVITFSTINLNHMITELDVVIVALASASTTFSIIDRVRSLTFRHGTGISYTTFFTEIAN